MFLPYIPEIDILAFSFVWYMQFVGPKDAFHTEKYCFRGIWYKNWKQVMLFLSVGFPNTSCQLVLKTNCIQHLQVMAPDILWTKCYWKLMI